MTRISVNLESCGFALFLMSKVETHLSACTEYNHMGAVTADFLMPDKPH